MTMSERSDPMYKEVRGADPPNFEVDPSTYTIENSPQRLRGSSQGGESLWEGFRPEDVLVQAPTDQTSLDDPVSTLSVNNLSDYPFRPEILSRLKQDSISLECTIANRRTPPDFPPPHTPHEWDKCKLYLEKWPEKRLRWKRATSVAALLLVLLPLFNVITYVYIYQKALNSKKTTFENAGRTAGAMLGMTTILAILYVISFSIGIFGVWKRQALCVTIFIANLMISSILYLGNAVVQIIYDRGLAAVISFLIVLYNSLLIVVLQKLIRRMETCKICY